MTQNLEPVEHPDNGPSRLASPRPSTESYTAHLRNISRQSLEADLLHISPASLSPQSTPRPGSSGLSTPRPASPALLPSPHNGPVHEPYRRVPAMTARPASHPPSQRASGRNTPISACALSPPSSRPQTPRSITPTGTTPAGAEKLPVAVSSSTHPPPRRSYQPDPFEHRTRWSKSRPKQEDESGYCCGLCAEPPTALTLCGSWLTGTGTMLLAGTSMACCAAALR